MNTRRQLLSLIAGLAGLPFIGGLLHRLEILRLIAALEHGDCMARFTAAGLLGNRHQAQAAVPALRNLLDDDCEAVRCDASYAIGQITGDWMAAAVVGRELLQHPDELVRVVGEEHLRRVEAHILDATQGAGSRFSQLHLR